jgi:hypothetical protein
MVATRRGTDRTKRTPTAYTYRRGAVGAPREHQVALMSVNADNIQRNDFQVDSDTVLRLTSLPSVPGVVTLAAVVMIAPVGCDGRPTPAPRRCVDVPFTFKIPMARRDVTRPSVRSTPTVRQVLSVCFNPAAVSAGSHARYKRWWRLKYLLPASAGLHAQQGARSWRALDPRPAPPSRRHVRVDPGVAHLG